MSETSFTAMPAPAIAFAVPPVETSSMPVSASVRARSTQPGLVGHRKQRAARLDEIGSGNVLRGDGHKRQAPSCGCGDGRAVAQRSWNANDRASDAQEAPVDFRVIGTRCRPERSGGCGAGRRGRRKKSDSSTSGASSSQENSQRSSLPGVASTSSLRLFSNSATSGVKVKPHDSLVAAVGPCDLTAPSEYAVDAPPAIRHPRPSASSRS
jgi:hypothetical protein